jgi:copper chaperone CopZ
MRVLFIAVALISTLGLVLTADQNSDKGGSTQVCSLHVSGMFCGACAKTVEKAAKKIDGVKAGKVSQPTGVAEITYDPSETNPQTIADVLTKKTPFKAEPQNREQKEKK